MICQVITGFCGIKEMVRDFPGGPVVKNLPSKAGDADSIPGQGTKVPCVTGHLSLHTTTRDPMYSHH